ncbi:MAG: flagellar biosynthesis anti-sigma factor FlgM [Phycisphaerales bacterium]|nr:flagellar biosynthesis anti-sigma factor FlgM [Phycisphaerales bacterium]
MTSLVVPGTGGRGLVSDHVQISDTARSRSHERLDQLHAERMGRIREQIAAGTYETDERVSAAAAALARALSP